MYLYCFFIPFYYVIIVFLHTYYTDYVMITPVKYRFLNSKNTPKFKKTNDQKNEKNLL